MCETMGSVQRIFGGLDAVHEHVDNLLSHFPGTPPSHSSVPCLDGDPIRLLQIVAGLESGEVYVWNVFRFCLERSSVLPSVGQAIDTIATQPIHYQDQSL